VGLLSAGPGVGASSPTLAAGDHHTCVITDRTTSSARDVLSCFGEPGAWSGTSAGPPSVLFDAPAGESLGDLDLGARHGCVTAFGGSAPSARCWGLGGAGRLGTGSTADAPVPLAVEAAGSSVLAVAGGADFSCLLGFLAPSFAVQCVGAGARGATGPLGVGRDALAFVTALDPALPVFTGADLGLDAGANHVCAPVPGALVCWGDNRHGQLGTGAGAELDPTPARVCFD
jgi:hypothetical protein